MESQVVFEAKGGIPEVKILDSPSHSPSNGHVPNGHTNRHVANGHLNGHIPNGDTPSNTTPFLNGDKSPHKENGHHNHTTHIIPRSPRLGTPHRRQYVPLDANDDEDMDKMVPMVECQPEETKPPIDRCYIVYCIMALHGIGTLLPWNMFITAEAYFTEHKFGNVSDDEEYKDKFISYLGITSFVPNITFLFVALFFPPKSSRFTTILAVNIMLILFVITTILAVVDTSDWPKVFFGLTMATIVFFNCGSAVYQSGLYSMCAKLPQKYMQSYIIGQGLGGTLVAVIGITTLAVVGDLKVAAIFYFACAVIVLFLCVVTLITMVKMPYMRYYLDQVTESSLEDKEREALEDKGHSIAKTFKELCEIFMEIKLQLFNIWICFSVTLAIFPAIMVGVRTTQPKPHSQFLQYFFVPLTCFLAFNVFDFIGSCIPAWVKWPSAKYTWIICVARIGFFPLFLLSNYRPETRAWPVLLNDWAYIIIVVAMSLSNGYMKTVVMMDGPQAVKNPNRAGKAASMMVFALVLGIFTGIQFSLVFPEIVKL